MGIDLIKREIREWEQSLGIFLVCVNGKEGEMKESCGDPSYRRERENVREIVKVTNENSDKSIILFRTRASNQQDKSEISFYVFF